MGIIAGDDKPREPNNHLTYSHEVHQSGILSNKQRYYFAVYWMKIANESAMFVTEYITSISMLKRLTNDRCDWFNIQYFEIDVKLPE